MKEDQRRVAVEQEVKQSRLALQAARLLRDAGLYNDALNRLCYALFHGMAALLLTEGVEPRRHRAVPSLLGAHFVASGKLTAADIAVVSRTYSYRDLADYERTWEATREITDAAFADVEQLLERARSLLAQSGYPVDRSP